jgi:hypothetical protein
MYRILRRKIMKKVFSIILIISLIISINFLAYADIHYGVELKDGYKSEATFNEFLMVKQLLEKSDNELYKTGYSIENVKELRGIDYEQIIYDRYVERYGAPSGLMSKEMTAYELVNKLTDEQIKSLTANCTVSHRLDPRNYYYDTTTNKTYAKITFSWAWSSEPIFKGIDIIGFGWDAQMYADTNTSYVNLYYYDTYDGSTRNEQHRFTQYQTYNVSDELRLFVGGEYPKSGSGALNLYCTGKNQNLGVSYKYGHTYLGLGAPSLAAPFGVGFTFTKNVTEYPSPIVTGHIN